MRDSEPGGPDRIGRDPEAFEAFYRRHVQTVTGFVARRADDPHTVDDLITEVFLAAIDAADGYRSTRGTESAWLIGIARNVLAAERRRIARQVDKTTRAAGMRRLDADDIVRLEEQIGVRGMSWQMQINTGLFKPGQSLIFGLSIGPGPKNGTTYGSSTFLATGQVTSCRFIPSPIGELALIAFP